MDTLIALVVGAIVNGAVTWGVVTTKLIYMERDIADNRAGLRVVNARIDTYLGRRRTDPTHHQVSQ